MIRLHVVASPETCISCRGRYRFAGYQRRSATREKHHPQHPPHYRTDIWRSPGLQGTVLSWGAY